MNRLLERTVYKGFLGTLSGFNCHRSRLCWRCRFAGWGAPCSACSSQSQESHNLDCR